MKNAWIMPAVMKENVRPRSAQGRRQLLQGSEDCDTKVREQEVEVDVDVISLWLPSF